MRCSSCSQTVTGNLHASVGLFCGNAAGQNDSYIMCATFLSG